MQFIKPLDNHEELKIYYLDTGILIRSTLELNKYGKPGSNYDVPITIVANRTWGVKVIHGLNMYSLDNKITCYSCLFDQGILMMNSNNNWWVFIPAYDADVAVLNETILLEIENYFKQSVSIYGRGEKSNIQYQNEHRTSFTYGLGVE